MELVSRDAIVRFRCEDVDLKNLDNRLRSLIRVATTNSETKGQLEFLLNLLCNGGDQLLDQASDDEQDNDDVRIPLGRAKPNSILLLCSRKIKTSWKLT